MAAVLRRTHDPDQPYRFVCAGSLVERDLVLTTASCASRLFKEPLRDFVVLLGASNLRVSLEFGVQHMELQEIIIHENYQIDSDVHSNDIGLLKLSRPATLDRTVCLLCLPPEGMELTARQSCSVTGYGLAEARR
ncbi:chymotrypsin-like elastase family member 2A [Pollicipes pollicipes]|uniref:chymotrypsin-like elastase family member 2A n=1 Tax=Pollicipes pollicipes TaxID=41117 RepID=UPI001884D821|nr:chymotrypsin-like elastase family member 2A [Pollicipes pollicipes]